jgi:hypothetical protein
MLVKNPTNPDFIPMQSFKFIVTIGAVFKDEEQGEEVDRNDKMLRDNLIKEHPDFDEDKIDDIINTWLDTKPVTDTQYLNVYIKNIVKIIYNEEDINTQIDQAIKEIEIMIQDVGSESGLQYHSIHNCVVDFFKYVPLMGANYIKLPAKISNKKAIINIKNNDDYCFAWCILRHLNPKEKNAERIDKELKAKINISKNLVSGLNVTGIKFPMTLKQIDLFEKQNPHLREDPNHERFINVYTCDDLGKSRSLTLILTMMKLIIQFVLFVHLDYMKVVLIYFCTKITLV